MEPGGINIERSRNPVHQVLIGLVHQKDLDIGRRLALPRQEFADGGGDFARSLQDDRAAIHAEGRVKVQAQILGESPVGMQN